MCISSTVDIIKAEYRKVSRIIRTFLLQKWSKEWGAYYTQVKIKLTFFLGLIYTGPPLIHASLIHDFGLFAVATLAPEFSGTDRQNDAKKPTTMAMMFRQQDIAQQRFS
mgnify:CR=1 FL=1